MRVLLLTQYYAPEPVDKFTDLARGLRQRGHQVEVITGFPCYPLGRTYDGYRQSFSRVERLDGVRIIRVPQAPDHSRSVVRRALYYLTFAIAAATIGLVRSHKADVLLVYQSALPTGLAAWVISRIKRIPYVLDVADLWPESVAASGMLKNQLALGLVRRVARFVYGRAAAVNVITEGYRRNLLGLGVPASKLRVIHSWPSASHLVKPEELTTSNNVASEGCTILYAGTIGPCQQLQTVIDAATLLRDDARIQFDLVGEGVERLAMEQRAAAAGASNVRFIGWKSPEEVARMAAAADLLLVHLKPDEMSRVSIPSKTFAYMASGRPLLMAVEGEAAELIERTACGVAAPPSQPAALADAIRSFMELPPAKRAAMGAAARQAFEQHFAPEVQIDKVVNSLTHVTAQAMTTQPAPRPRFAVPLYRRFGKRLLDVSMALPALVVLSPLIAAVAIAVRVRLGAPVLFKQRRAGRGGRPFVLIKFRTMTDERSPDGQALSDEQRLTRFGTFLRSTSLDELPELWNVLRGDMSLVGPRPLLLDYLPIYTEEQARRHEVKPGITGWAQVHGRNAICWEAKFRFDVWYVDHHSLWQDLKILMQTCWKVVLRSGVNKEGFATTDRFGGNTT